MYKFISFLLIISVYTTNQQDFTQSSSSTSTSTTTAISSSSSTSTDTSTMTSTTTPVSSTTTTINRMDEIRMLLKLDSISRCAFDSDPYIIALCPHYSELLIDQLNSDNRFGKADFLRLSDIEKALINKNTIETLNTECKANEWCLGNEHTIEQNASFGKYLINNYGKSLCMVSTCFGELRDYVAHCAYSNMTKHLFDLVPSLCDIHKTNSTNTYCLEESLKLIHTSYAVTKRTNATVVENVQDCMVVTNESRTCTDACKTIVKDIHRLESCCKNTELIHSFKPLNWYFNNKTIVKSECSSGLMTSLCLNKQGIYIEVSSSNFYIISGAVSFVVIMSVSVGLLLCFRKTKTQPFVSDFNTDSTFHYSKLYNYNNYDEDDEYDNTTTTDENDYYTSSSIIMADKLSKYSGGYKNTKTEMKNLL